MNSVQLIKKLYNSVYNRYKVYKFRKDMEQKLTSSPLTFTPLSDDEKKEISEYWKKYQIAPDYNTFLWYYNVSIRKDPRYISEDIYANYILPTFNDMRRCEGINDKNLFDILFFGEKMATTIVRRINGFYVDTNYNLISHDKAIDIVSHYDSVVIKPTINSCQGKGIICVNGKKFSKEEKNYNSDFIVQELIKQHKSLAELNDSSVNVIRVTTLAFGGAIQAIDAIIRVGAPGQFTDHKNIAIGLTNGVLKQYGVTTNGTHVDILPNGYRFGGKEIVSYNRILDMVIRLHSRILPAGIVGWDVTVDEVGDPLIIEANLDFPGCIRSQDCNGPLFGDNTEDILKYCLDKAKK